MNASLFQRALPFLAVLGSVTALGLGTSFAKQLFPIIGAQGTTALRVGFSALILLLRWRPWRWPLSRKDARAIIQYGAALGVMNLMFYMALRTIPFGIAVAIEFSGPLGVALLSSRRRIDFLWLGLAALGLGLILPLGARAGSLDPVGVLYAMGAALCWALYIIYGKRASHLHSGHIVSLGLVVASMVALPVGIIHAGTALLDWKLLFFGMGIALVSSTIPMSLEMVALKRLPREAFGIMISMEPAVAALLGLMVLGEHLSAIQWLAIGCTILASVGSICTIQARPPVAAATQQPS